MVATTTVNGRWQDIGNMWDGEAQPEAAKAVLRDDL
jgi:hypothetical protein